tara:strand:- start:4 stop:576 length:573 start_codon:yes stop_codon:yes gene_type:complete
LSSRKFLRAVTKDRQRLTNTIMSGFGEIPTNVMWPLWLLVIGYDYTTVGAVAVFTVLLRIGFSGFAGRMANRFPNKALCYGAGMLFCGWVPWIFGESIALIPLTILTWSIGNHFRSVGLTSQWYDAKSVSSLTAYEATLCVGRVLSILVCVPVLMIYPQYYPWIGAGAFLMMALYNFHVRHVAPDPIQIK